MIINGNRASEKGEDGAKNVNSHSAYNGDIEVESEVMIFMAVTVTPLRIVTKVKVGGHVWKTKQ